MLLVGYLPYMWTLSATVLTRHLGMEITVDDAQIPRALVFVLLTTVVGMVLDVPFELYSTFVIEARHGFNKQTLGLFFMDKLKGLMLTFVLGKSKHIYMKRRILIIMIMIGGPVLYLLITLIQWGGEYFYLYVWGFLFCFTLLMVTIIPIFIMPLFNKFTPLEDGELRTQIEELAMELNFPLKKLFVCDGSKRSSHSSTSSLQSSRGSLKTLLDAYFYGFFNSKRIVLFDTLLTQATNEEIVAILGHELGNWGN